VVRSLGPVTLGWPDLVICPHVPGAGAVFSGDNQGELGIHSPDS